jgi:hypothetical protein
VEVEDDGGSVLVAETSAPLEFHQAVSSKAQAAQVRVFGIEGLDEDLESVFRYLMS